MYIKATKLNGQKIHYLNKILTWKDDHYILLKRGFFLMSVNKLPIIEKIRRNNNKIGKLVLITFSKVIRSYNKFTQSFVTSGGKNRLVINR